MTVAPVRIITMPIQSQGIITRDNVSVDVSAVAYYRVVDAVKAVVAIENAPAAINQIAQTTLRKVVGQHSRRHATAQRRRGAFRVHGRHQPIFPPACLGRAGVNTEDFHRDRTTGGCHREVHVGHPAGTQSRQQPIAVNADRVNPVKREVVERVLLVSRPCGRGNTQFRRVAVLRWPVGAAARRLFGANGPVRWRDIDATRRPPDVATLGPWRTREVNSAMTITFRYAGRARNHSLEFLDHDRGEQTNSAEHGLDRWPRVCMRRDL